MRVSGIVEVNAKERRLTMIEGVTGPLLLLLLLPKQEKRARSAEEKDILMSS